MGAENRNKPVYTIGIAAGLLNVHPQTLRMYERLGFIIPHRTKGQTRLYSENNIERVLFIKDLTQRQRINLAGVEVILKLRQTLDQLRLEMETLMERLRNRIGDSPLPEQPEKRMPEALTKIIRITVEKG